MIGIFRSVCLVTMAFTACASNFASCADSLDAEGLSVIKQAIHKKVDEGDYSALRQATLLPTGEAIDFLWWYANQGERASREAARSTLKDIPGVVEYLSKRLQERTRQGLVDDESFSILGALGTSQAAAVVAPYLFDGTQDQGDGDTLKSVTGVSATVTLGSMKLENAPTPKHPNHYGFSEIVAWQQWAVDHKLAPKEWRSRIGTDPWLRDVQQIERNYQMNIPGGVAPTEMQPRAAAELETPSKVLGNTAPTEAATTALPPKVKISVSSLWWAMGIAAVAMGIAWILGRRK